MNHGLLLIVLGSASCCAGVRRSAAIATEMAAKEAPSAETVHAMYLEAMSKENELMKEVQLQKVKRALGELSLEALEELSSAGNEGLTKLVDQKLEQVRRKAAEQQQVQQNSVGADEATREKARQKMRAEWGVQCGNGLDVKFVKTADFEESFDDLTDSFAPNKTILAFDMDGTLDWMKEHDTAATISTLREKAAGMKKVVITARRNDRMQGCNLVLQTLMRGGGGADIKEMFRLPEECVEENRVRIEGGGKGPLVMPGLIMNEYDKAGGLLAYQRAGLAGIGSQHLIFYDDFVTNPVNMAKHLCRYEKWPALKQVTAVWYATPEAELRDNTIAARVKSGTVSADMHYEGSFFSPKVDDDAALAGQRALFGVD